MDIKTKHDYNSVCYYKKDNSSILKVVVSEIEAKVSNRGAVSITYVVVNEKEKFTVPEEALLRKDEAQTEMAKINQKLFA